MTRLKASLYVWCVQSAAADVAKLHQGLESIQSLSSRLSHHFCEDARTFKLEECLGVFSAFCDKVKECQKVIDLESYCQACHRCADAGLIIRAAFNQQNVSEQ